MLVDLVRNDTEKESGLEAYLRNMMSVMAFDVERRDRVITQTELSQYTLWLAKAVTEYMFYFIGHGDPPPQGAARYHAVSGAHVVHMLRDLLQDIEVGYYNIPAEILETEHTSLDNLGEAAFRKWVSERIQLAQQYFSTGRDYISRVKNLRLRLAGFAYLARFEWMAKTIEQDQFCLRPAYPERKCFKAVVWMTWSVIRSLLNIPSKKYKYTETIAFKDHCEER